MEHEWNMNGTWMEHEWNMNGTWMEHEWNMNGIWMEHEWNMNGTLVDRLLSKMAGNAPNFPWRSFLLCFGKPPGCFAEICRELRSDVTGWWCWLTILKNDGVKDNGFRMTSLIYEMENNPFMFQTTNQVRNPESPSVLSWFSTAEDKSFPAATGIGSGIGDSSFLNYSDLNTKSHNRVCFASLAFIPTPESSLLSRSTPYIFPRGKRNHRSNPFKLSISKKTLKPPFHSTSTPFLF